MIRKLLIASLVLLAQSVAFAGEADVVGVEASKAADGTYTFHVSVLHADTGEEHYANKYEVVSEEGEVLGTRTLWHPHVNEQPFTRSLSGVEIPETLDKVIVRAHDSKHGFGGKEVEVSLPLADSE